MDDATARFPEPNAVLGAHRRKEIIDLGVDVLWGRETPSDIGLHAYRFLLNYHNDDIKSQNYKAA